MIAERREDLGMAWCKMNNSSQPYPMYLYTPIPYIRLVQGEAMMQRADNSEDDRRVCKICGFVGATITGVAFHISVTHGITTKEYYDMYLKGENEGKCVHCGKQTRFYNLGRGYPNYRCSSCIARINNKIASEKRNAAIRFIKENINLFSDEVKAKTYDALHGKLKEEIDFNECIFCHRKFVRSGALATHLEFKHGIRGMHEYWNLFYYKRRDFLNHCVYCKKEIIATSTFCKACRGEAIKESWGNRDKDEKENIKRNITRGLQKFYQTKEGKILSEKLGEANSIRLKGGHISEAQKANQSKALKEKIKKGEFTPQVINSFTHWQYTFQGRKFRSSWEVEVYKQLLKRFSKGEILYEKLRIPYRYLEEEHTYLVDFFIPDFQLSLIHI